MHVLAIDIGGTKVEAAIVDDRGTATARHRVPTPVGVDAEATFAAVVGVARAALATHDSHDDGDASGSARPQVARCGVGCGGPMRFGGSTVSPLNIPAWREFALVDRLEAALGFPVAIDNDAKALALAEGWLGAAVGVADFLAMVVSTGVGGGIVSRGRLLDGADGNAGHIGHVFVADGTEPWDRHPAGLLESEASGTAIARRTGAPAAQATATEVERVGSLVGRGVASVANLLDLRLAVVAGSVALGYGAPFFAAAQAEVDRLCGHLDHARGARIVPAGLGDRGPLVGAAAVARRAAGLDIGVR